MISHQGCKSNGSDIINDGVVADEAVENSEFDNISSSSNSIERHCSSSIRSYVVYDSPQLISFNSDIEVIDEVVPDIDVKKENLPEDSAFIDSSRESLRKDEVLGAHCMRTNIFEGNNVARKKSDCQVFFGFKKEFQTQDELRRLASLQMEIEVPKWRLFPEFEALLNKNKIKSLKDIHEWRLKPIDPDYAAESIEEIDDETFLKRHTRYEQDEKRRKRWDIQRMREQQEYERLKANEARKGRKEKKRKTESTATNPQPSREITHLIVTDTTYLPWMDGDFTSLSPLKSLKS